MTTMNIGNGPRDPAALSGSGDDAPPEGGPRGPLVDIYARLSFAPGGKRINVADQIAMGTEDIVARGGRVGEVYEDNSKSAWNPKVVRGNWQTMMERLESGASDGVWVYNADRFTRKIMEGERLVEAAQKGLRVWSRYSDYDLRTADGRDAFRSAIQAAARESDRNSERTQDGKARAARAGLQHGGIRPWAMPGLAPASSGDGNDDERVPAWKSKRAEARTWETDERVAAERDIARECILRLLDGESGYALAAELTARGAAGERAALPVSGRAWNPDRLYETLVRPAIAGLLEFRGEIVGKLSDIDPIVDRGTWELFVAKCNARKTGRPLEPVNILTYSMRCGRCGAPVVPYKRSGRSVYDDGAPRRDYRCPSPNQVRGSVPSCGRNTIDARFAEEAVCEAMVVRLRDPQRAELISEEMSQARSHRAEIIDRIETTEAEADKLSSKVGDWGVDRVDTAMKPLLRKIDELRAQLDQLGDDQMRGAAVDDAVAKWERVRADGDVETQRRMIRRTFPNLTLAPHAGRMDLRVDRLLWDGPVPA